MFREFLHTWRLRRLRSTFRAGAEISRFIAKDVRRDIQVLDDSRVDDGYVTARVRTTNVLYVTHNLEAAPEFGAPEILHLDRAWAWGGDSWGGKEPIRLKIPLLTSNALCNALHEQFPRAQLSEEVVNAEHRSWRVTMTVGDKRLEFVWGPLSGFGGINPDVEDENAFAYCDEYLYSLDDAVRFAMLHNGAMA